MQKRTILLTRPENSSLGLKKFFQQKQSLLATHKIKLDYCINPLISIVYIKSNLLLTQQLLESSIMLQNLTAICPQNILQSSDIIQSETASQTTNPYDAMIVTSSSALPVLEKIRNHNLYHLIKKLKFFVVGTATKEKLMRYTKYNIDESNIIVGKDNASSLIKLIEEYYVTQSDHSDKSINLIYPSIDKPSLDFYTHLTKQNPNIIVHNLPIYKQKNWHYLNDYCLALLKQKTISDMILLSENTTHNFVKTISLLSYYDKIDDLVDEFKNVVLYYLGANIPKILQQNNVQFDKLIELSNLHNSLNDTLLQAIITQNSKS